MNQKLYKKIKPIKLILTDVDGVLTDGGMYYSSHGDIMKRFFARDGMGVTLLRKNNIPTIIITKENTMIVKQWSKKMKIEKIFDGIKHKEQILKKICTLYNIDAKAIAFIGDDINDIELLKLVGFSVTPSDGSDEVKKICDYICENSGGYGAFRELADLILKSKSLSVNYK